MATKTMILGTSTNNVNVTINGAVTATTLSGNTATTSVDGLMSATDKTKLDSLIEPSISGTALLLN